MVGGSPYAQLASACVDATRIKTNSFPALTRRWDGGDPCQTTPEAEPAVKAPQVDPVRDLGIHEDALFAAGQPEF